MEALVSKLKKKLHNYLMGGAIGYIAGATGLKLSHSMDGAKIYWILLPMAVILGAVLYDQQVED